MRATKLLVCLALVLACAGVAGASGAAANETRVPGARINMDEGFEFGANAAGDYVIAWPPNDDRITRILRGSVSSGIQRTWKLRTGYSSTPDVAIAANGTMAASWTEESSGPNSYYRKKFGAIWNVSDVKLSPHLLANSRTEIAQDVGAVHLAINDTGTAAFAWQTAFPTERINVAIGRPDGSFTPSRRIFKNNRPGFLGDPEVSIDGAGRTMVRWSDFGLNCKEDWFVPKHCKNRAPDLRYAVGSADLQFAVSIPIGKRCSWGASDSNSLGQNFYFMDCESGYYYLTSQNGLPFSSLQKLQTLGGKRDYYSPDVKVLEDGTVFVVFESLRFKGKAGSYSQTAGSRGAFGEVLGPPFALTPEFDSSAADDLPRSSYLDGPIVLEGPGSQVYIAHSGPDSGMFVAMGKSGQVGPEIRLPEGAEPRFTIAPGGVGFSVFTREKEYRHDISDQLWTSTFTLPPPSL
jgi:hypothetical protein